MITLPPLPEPDFALDQGDEPCYYAHTVRDIQLAAARAALEAAANRVRDRRQKSTAHNSFQARANHELMEASAAIRALEIAP